MVINHAHKNSSNFFIFYDFSPFLYSSKNWVQGKISSYALNPHIFRANESENLTAFLMKFVRFGKASSITLNLQENEDNL